jgi:cytoskeletal protein RodZ
VSQAGFETESIGSILKRERELRQVSIEEMAQTTRIPIRMLQNLESDRFEELPGDVFVRGFVRSYARSLGIDEAPLLARYGALHGTVETLPVAMPAIAPPERGRRYGVTFAVVVLLVLFTLALSVVLRPRHRDLPMELSRTDAPVNALERHQPPFRADRRTSS